MSETYGCSCRWSQHSEGLVNECATHSSLRKRAEKAEASLATETRAQDEALLLLHEQIQELEAKLAEAQGIANSRDRGWAEETRLRKATEAEVERLRSSIASYQAAAHNYVNEHAEVARLRDLIVALSEDERGLVTAEVHAAADRIRALQGGGE